MATYVALLRGINVGGKNRISMADLVAAFEAAGAKDVRTYIQSGNVVLSADAKTAKSLAANVAARLQTKHGLSTPVVLRTASEIRESLTKNPFLARGESEESTHLMFLADVPDASAIAALDPNRSPGDSFAVVGREVYLWLPNGAGRSKLTNAYFDSKLKTVSTARNWRTVKALAELCG